MLQSHIEVFQFQEDAGVPGIFSVPLDHGLLSDLKVKNAKNVVFIPGKITPASERKHTSPDQKPHRNRIRGRKPRMAKFRNDEKIIIHYLDSLPEPKSTLLPKRLFVVVGLESSGTKFVSQKIASLLGIDDVGEHAAHGRINIGRAEIQHFSLPWGRICTQTNIYEEDNGGIIPFVPPRECGRLRNINNNFLLFQNQKKFDHKEECNAIGVPNLVIVPPRFLVNITSHVNWYEERGVQVTAVIVSRDRSVVRASASKAHCTDKAMHEAEIESGERIIRDAIEKLNSPRRNYEIESSDKVSPLSKLVFVSYESLLELRNDGYMEYFRWQLGLPNIDDRSCCNLEVRDGNKGYLQRAAYIMGEKLTVENKKHGEVSSFHPAQKMSSRDIPNQIITVVGLESSGSKFISQLLYPYFEDLDEVELDYQTLPGGKSSFCSGRETVEDKRSLLPFLLPLRCRNDYIYNCQALQQHIDKNEDSHFLNNIPNRFFLNITSHFDWYDKRGIPSTAVIVTRDPTVTQASAAKAHCHNLSVHTSEFGFGNDLIGEFLRIQSNPDTAIKSTNVVIVSYESMISLGISYLRYVLKQIDNEYDLSKVNRPSIDIMDMNQKYMFGGPYYSS